MSGIIIYDGVELISELEAFFSSYRPLKIEVSNNNVEVTFRRSRDAERAYEDFDEAYPDLDTDIYIEDEPKSRLEYTIKTELPERLLKNLMGGRWPETEPVKIRKGVYEVSYDPDRAPILPDTFTITFTKKTNKRPREE